MKYMTGNILDYLGRPDAICITTNGFVTTRGDAVMGMGIAKAFSDLDPRAKRTLGRAIDANGNCVQYLTMWKNKTHVLAFPVKPNQRFITDLNQVVSHARDKYVVGQPVPGFHCVADLDIIRRSCKELMAYLDEEDLDHCIIPIPGCGAGELSFNRDGVRQVCEEELDDRVWMMSFNTRDFTK